MKAALYEGVGRIRMVDIPKPVPGPGEIVIKVDYCGICGTDIHAYMYEGIIAPGTVLGHETVGTIVEMGSGINGLKVGDRIIPSLLNYQCSCYYHRHGKPHLCPKMMSVGAGVAPGTIGGYAEFHKCTSGIKIPDNVALEDAVLWDIFCTALGGIRKSRFKIGDNVAVVGCGAVGLAAVQLLSLGGAAYITAVEIDDRKRELALKYGADLAVSPDEELDIKQKIENAHYSGVGCDVTYEIAGNSKAVSLAVNLCKKGGQALIIGTSMEPLETIRPAELILSEVEIKPSFVSGEEELFSFLKLLSAGRINTKGMITEVVRLDDIPEVMERLSKTAIQVRVAVKP